MLDVVSVLHSMADEDAGEAAREMLAAIGVIGDWQPWSQCVIGATYIRGGVSKGGIIIPDSKGGTTHNDQLLGKAFLLVAAGPAAFPERLLPLYGGAPPLRGSWFFAKAADGIQISLKFPGASNDNRLKQYGWPCRIFEAEDLLGPLPHPACVV